MSRDNIYLIIKIALSVTVIISAIYTSFDQIDHQKSGGGDYDEKMWTGASIASYHMFFKGYERKRVIPERWFQNYAQKYQIDIRSIPFSELQWFDDAMWTAGWKAPNIAKFFMGATINTFADTIIDPEGYFHVWNENKEINKWPGNYSPYPFVLIARKLNALFNVGTIITLILIGWLYLSFWPGLIAGAYLAFNPTFTLINQAVGVDSTSAFFSTLTLLIIMLLIQKLKQKASNRTIVIISVLAGISFAFAVGSKLSAALMGYVLALIFAGLAYKQISVFFTREIDKEKKKRYKDEKERSLRLSGAFQNLKTLVISGLVVAGTTFLIFIYSNPVLYTQPTLKVKIIRESVKEFFDMRAKSFGTNDINKSMTKSLGLLLKRNGIKTEDRYYGTFGHYLDFRGNFLDFGFFSVGAFFLFGVARKKWGEGEVSVDALLLVTMTVLVLGTAKFIWIDWERYHTPLYPVYSLIIGYGIYQLCLKATSRFWNKEAMQS